jgi:hypothetical protein
MAVVMPYAALPTLISQQGSGLAGAARKGAHSAVAGWTAATAAR